MGLLDEVLNSDQGRLGLGLLAAAGPSFEPMSIGQRLFGAMNMYRGQKTADEDRLLRKSLIEAQTANYQGEAADRQAQAKTREAALARQEEERKLLTGLFTPTSGVQAASLPGGPTNENAQAIGQMPQITPQMFQQLIAAGVDPAKIKAIAEAKNLGRNEIANWKKIRTPQGVVEQGYDRFGDPVGGAIRPYVDPVQVNQGDRITFQDPTQIQSGQQFGVNMTPGERASNALGWANNSIAGQRLALDQSNANKPQYHDGAWVTPPTFSQPQGSFTPTQAYAPPKGTPQYQAQASDKVLNVLSDAESLIKQSTGSYLGAGADLAARAFGKTTPGAAASAQLKVLEGAIMFAQPRMEGPQSDKDTMLYRQMAGNIGDPTIPNDQKLAAIKMIRELHEKYATKSGPSLGKPITSGNLTLTPLLD